MSVILDIFEPLSDVSLWALDETGVWLESSNYYSWSPKGQPTVIEHNGSHKGLNIIGATEILKHFGFIYEAYSKGEEDSIPVCADHIIAYLENLMKYDQSRGIRKTLVILDNARIHTAEVIKEFARENKDQLVLIFQPPYSPELNPQENMWNWLKKFIAQSLAHPDISTLVDRVLEFQTYCNNHVEEVNRRVNARHYYK